MKRLLLALILGLLPLSVFAQMPYSVRKDSVVAFFRGADIGFDAYSAIAKLSSPETREKGVAVAVSALNTPPPHDPRSVSSDSAVSACRILPA